MLLDDIERHLQDGGFGDALYLAARPSNAPTACTLVGSYAGSPPIRASGGVAAELPKLQVIVRAASRPVADARIEAIKQYLDGTADVTINQTRYIWIHALSEPFPLRTDERGNVEVACNFEVLKVRTQL